MNYSRFLTRVRGVSALSGLALMAAIPALGPAEAVPSYDGVWSVVIITKEPHRKTDAPAWNGSHPHQQ